MQRAPSSGCARTRVRIGTCTELWPKIGLYVATLIVTTGRSSYVISFIEFDALAAAWDRGHAGDKNAFNVLVDSPAELALQPGEFPVVAFLVFNQYLGILNS